MTASAYRNISFPLMAGLIALPTVFAWILLLPGYAGSTRIAAFVYAFAPLALSLIAAGIVAEAG